MDDTDPEIREMQIEGYRRMSPGEKMEIVAGLNRTVYRLAEAGVRQQYPDATDREVVLRIAARRYGREIMVSLVGWDPEIEGW